MHRSNILASRFREVMLNGTWVALTNWKDQLDKTDFATATQKVGDLNTIALLTYHIHYYIGGVLQVLQGGSLDIHDKYAFDMSAFLSESDWENMKMHLFSDAEAFAHAVEQLPDEILNTAFVDPKYGTYLRNIDGMIEHAYYHLGQVALIRKMFGVRG